MFWQSVGVGLRRAATRQATPVLRPCCKRKRGLRRPRRHVRQDANDQSLCQVWLLQISPPSTQPLILSEVPDKRRLAGIGLVVCRIGDAAGIFVVAGRLERADVSCRHICRIFSVMENAAAAGRWRRSSPACVFQLPSIGSAQAAPAMINVAARARLTFRNISVLPLGIRPGVRPPLCPLRKRKLIQLPAKQKRCRDGRLRDFREAPNRLVPAKK